MNNGQTAAAAENELHFLDYWRIIRIRKWVILSVFLLVVTTTTVITLMRTPVYSSTVSMVVSKDLKNAPGVMDNGLQGLGYDPYFLQTQFELIQSKEILHQVINELGLNALWGQRYGNPVPFDTTETFQMLLRRMDVRQVRNTEYIEVTVLSEDPEEAALIANRIVEVYRDHRLSIRKARLTSGIKTLEKEWEDRQKEVNTLHDDLEKMRADLKLPARTLEANGYTITFDAETLSRLEAERIAAERRFEESNQIVVNLESKTPDELKNSILTVQFDAPLATLLTERDAAEVNFEAKANDFGEDHDEYKKAAKALATIKRQIDTRVSGIMDGLYSQRDALKKNFDLIAKEVADAKQANIKMASETVPFNRMRRDLESKMRLLEVLELRINTAKVEIPLSSEDIVQITGPAEPSTKPDKPNIPLNVALSVIVGFVGGFGLAFFIEYLDTSVKTIDDVEAALGTPVLSVIPQNVGSLIEEGADSPHAEAYRVLRTNIMFGRTDPSLNTVTAVSGGAGEGKSTTIFNLATVFAQNGSKVLLIDSDLRRPSLHRILGVENTPGLTDVLMESTALEDAIQTTGEDNLHFLPSGKLPSSAMGILNSPQLRELKDNVSKRYDFVFFDAPPIMGVSDASILASMMDMCILVIQYRKYPQAMNVRAKQTVDKVGGNLLGVVMNNISMSQDAYSHYYGGYAHNHYNRDDSQIDPEEKKQARGKAKSAQALSNQDSRSNLSGKY